MPGGALVFRLLMGTPMSTERSHMKELDHTWNLIMAGALLMAPLFSFVLPEIEDIELQCAIKVLHK